MNSYPVSADSYIPQKQPIVLIDNVLFCDDNKTVTDYHIAEDTLFVENGRLQAVGLMENIAQSCAARTGLRKKMGTDGNPVKIGVIGAVNHFTIHHLPAVGDHITTTVTEISDFYPALLVSAEITLNAQTLATAEMKVFVIEKN